MLSKLAPAESETNAWQGVLDQALAAMQSTGPSFGYSPSQAEKDALFVGTSRSPSPEPARPSRPTTSPLRQHHPPRPDSQPRPEGTNSFLSNTNRFPSQKAEHATLSPEIDVKIEGPNPAPSQQWAYDYHDEYGQQTFESSPTRLPQVQQPRTPLLVGLHRVAPNETRMRELFHVFMRSKHQDPAPGAHNVWSPKMKSERTEHHRPHLPWIDGPRPLPQKGQLNTRGLEMDKTMYKKTDAPPPTEYNPQKSALACTLRRQEMSPAVAYKPTEKLHMVSKSKSIMDGRKWQDPSLPAQPLAFLQPPPGVRGTGHILQDQPISPRLLAKTEIIQHHSLPVPDVGTGAPQEFEDKYAYQISRAISISRSSRSDAGDSGLSTAREVSPRSPTGLDKMSLAESLHHLSLRQAEEPAETPATDNLTTTASAPDWEAETSSATSVQFHPLARLSDRPTPMEDVPVIVPPSGVLRKSIAGRAPSDWDWEALTPTERGGFFSASHGGAYKPTHRTWNKTDQQERLGVLGKVQTSPKKRAPEGMGPSTATDPTPPEPSHVTGWTPPDWVKDFGDANLFPPRSEAVGSFTMSESQESDSGQEAAAAVLHPDALAGGSPAVLGTLPIPSDAAVGPSVNDLVRHETAAALADRAMEVQQKQLQWSIRSRTMKSTMKGIGTSWERSGRLAKFAMNDPLRDQPLPKKRAAAEGL